MIATNIEGLMSNKGIFFLENQKTTPEVETELQPLKDEGINLENRSRNKSNVVENKTNATESKYQHQLFNLYI